MAASFAFPEAIESYHRRLVEALVGLMRESRLTLLLGAAGSGKTTVLKRLLPRLPRRISDRALPGMVLESGVTDLPDRRRAHGMRDVAVYFDGWDDAPLPALGRRIDEVLFAQYGVLPDNAMPDSSAEWLAAKLEAASRRSHVRFLIVLDAFEIHLGAFAERAGIVAFDDALIEVLAHRALPVHFLIACRDDAEPAFERLRARIGELANGSLRILVLDNEEPMASGALPVPAGSSPAPHDATHAEPSHEARDGFPFIGEDEPRDALEEEQRHALRLALQDEWAGEASLSRFSDRSTALPGDEPAPLSPWPSVALADVDAREPRDAANDESRASPHHESPVAADRGTRHAPGQERRQASEIAWDPAVFSAPWSLAPTASVRNEPVPIPSPASAAGRQQPWARRPALVALVVVAILGAEIVRFAQSPPSVDHPPYGAKPPTARAVASAAASGPTARGSTPALAPTTMPAPVRPAFVMRVDSDRGTDARIAGELRDRVAAVAGIDVRVRASSQWSDGFERPDGQSRLAILRYDALQAARSTEGSAGLAQQPQIVLPLYTEPIFVVVRREAPMTFIHELEGRRINIGPETSERGLTGARLYENLFGRPAAVGQMNFDDEASALAALVEDRGLDAMVVVGTELGGLFTGRAAAWKSRVKLLRIDAANPATRRAQRFFLTSVARGDAGTGLPDADTPVLAELAFLVTSEPSDKASAADLTVLAGSLCASLPALQRDGDPKWREVRIDTRFEVGLPYAPAALEGFRACQSARDGQEPKISQR